MRLYYPLLIVAMLFPVSVSAVEATQGWMRAMPPGQTMAAAYLTLSNPASSAVSLTAAASPSARSVEIHQSSQVDGMWRMRQLSSLEIPAGGTAVLSPGGTHLMLFGLQSPPAEGDRIVVTLTFDNDQSLAVDIAVRPLGSDPHDHH